MNQTLNQSSLLVYLICSFKVFYTMQNLVRLIHEAARYLGGMAFQQSIIKKLFLVFMITATLSQALVMDNRATLSATCDNTTMYVKINFTHTFHGTVYQSKNYFDPSCSYTVPIDSNVTEVDLHLHYRTCEIETAQVGNKTMVSVEMALQFHNLLDTVYDSTANVSCEIENYHMDPTDEIKYNPFAARGLEHSWIQLKNGHDILGEVGEPTESTLFLVVGMRDDGSNQDMVVQNCLAHTDKNVTNSTTVRQLSNFYGCPDQSAVLSNFTVRRSKSDEYTMFAYAPFTNFSLFARGGRLFATCGITVCATKCPAHCNDTESPFQLPLSDYATKDIISRAGGSIMPGSLQDLNRHNDRSRRIVKRSVGSFLSSFFRWESRVISGSISDGNITNVTSTNVGRKVVLSSVSKGTIVSANKSASTAVKDGFCMDWQTFRFVALMTICLFITVVSCYCCYAGNAEKKDKGRIIPFVF